MRVIAGVLVSFLALQGMASAETIKLKNGTKLEDATIVEQNDEVTVVEDPVLGRLEFPTADIKPPEEKKVKPGVFGTSFLEGWDKALSAGFSGSSGVSDENNVNMDLELKDETEHHRDNFVAKYFFADADGGVTNHEVSVTELHAFLITDSRWFAFLDGGYKWDDLQLWIHRVTASGGAGYDFLRDDTYRLTGRVGLGFTATIGDGRSKAEKGKNPLKPEKFVPNDEREDFNGVVAVEFNWNIVEGASFSSQTAYLPVLNDMPQFRAVSAAEFKIAIGVVEGLSFKLGGSYEYDSQNAERNDRKYYGNLVYDF